MFGIGKLVGRITSASEFYLNGILQQFTNKNVFLWAQAVAFKVVVSVVPIFVLGIGIIGGFLRQDKFFETMSNIVGEFLPSSLATYVIQFGQDLQRVSGAVTTIGLVGLLLTALTLFSTLRSVLSNVFKEQWHVHRSPLKAYLFDLRMAAQVGLLFILTLTISIVFQTLQIAEVAFLSGDTVPFIDITHSWPGFVDTVGLFLPYLVSLGMFFQLYYLIPIPRPPKRSVMLGATLAATMWEAAKQLFTHYAARVGAAKYFIDSSNPDGFAALSETFGMLVAFVLWSYYSGLVLVIGGIAVVLHESRHRLIRPERFDTEVTFKSAEESTNKP